MILPCITCQVLESALRSALTPDSFVTAEIQLERHRLNHVQDPPTAV